MPGTHVEKLGCVGHTYKPSIGDEVTESFLDMYFFSF